MGDYIDREKALNFINMLIGDDYRDLFETTTDYIRSVRAEDVARVVRCKDCVCADPDPRRENRQWCKAYLKIMRDDDFCSRGAKKEMNKNER